MRDPHLQPDPRDPAFWCEPEPARLVDIDEYLKLQKEEADAEAQIYDRDH